MHSQRDLKFFSLVFQKFVPRILGWVRQVLVIFKSFWIRFQESCSPLLPVYRSSLKKKTKSLQKKDLPISLHFLKKKKNFHKLSTSPSSTQQPSFHLTNHIIGFNVARQGTREDLRVLFTFLLLDDQPIQNSDQSS